MREGPYAIVTAVQPVANEVRGEKQAPLLAHFFIQKSCHYRQSLCGFRQLKVIPECMGKSFEDDQLRVASCAQQGSVKDGGITEQQISCAGDQQAGRNAAKVGIKRRKHWVLAVDFADILVIRQMIRICWLKLSREPVQREQLSRFADP